MLINTPSKESMDGHVILTRRCVPPSGGAAGVEKERFALLLYILDGRRALWDNRIICDQEDHMCMRVVALRLSSARRKVLRPRHEGHD